MSLQKALQNLCIGFGVLFAFVTVLIVYVPTMLSAFDTFFSMLVAPIQTPAILNAMLVFTNFGSVAGIAVGLLVLMVLYRHRPDIITRLWIALIGSVFSGEYLKALVHRARPDTLPGLQPIIDSYSYPSGHATGSIVFYGFLAILLYTYASTRIRKVFAVVLPVLLILLIGASRIILGYHFASDVLGGYLLGACWLTFSLAIPLYYELYHQTTQERYTHSEPIVRPML